MPRFPSESVIGADLADLTGLCGNRCCIVSAVVGAVGGG